LQADSPSPFPTATGYITQQSLVVKKTFTKTILTKKTGIVAEKR
jgi:hypothetical protein